MWLLCPPQYSNSTSRPYKVWSSDRQRRKSITASSLSEFKLRGAEKLGFENYSNLRVVLENDGTEVEDDSYFQAADKDTVFLLLRDNESWSPPGIDTLKSGMWLLACTLPSSPLADGFSFFPTALAAIPQIVCDTINSMQLANKAPTWSIKDDQGFITVILQWEYDDKLKYGHPYDDTSWKLSSSQTPHPYGHSYGDKVYSSTFPRPSSSRAKSVESYLRGARNLGSLEAYRSALPFKTLSADDFSFVDRMVDDLSSAHDLTSYCDFHCSSLHREGGSIKVSKSVGTSPIPDFSRTVSPTVTYSRTTSPFADPVTQGEPSAQAGIKAKKGHVRFMDVDKSATHSSAKQNISLMGLLNGRLDVSGSNSDESETETTEREDEQLCERYLLLVDQLSASQKKHLNIKDIGVILERLKSKIVDIDKLERDKENVGCHNWLIKATIRGEMLREIGLVYNGQYYGLMEHPGLF